VLTFTRNLSSFTPNSDMASPTLSAVWSGECTPVAVARLLDEAPAQMVPLVRELSSWAADELAQALTAVPPPALPVASGAAAAPPHAAPSAEPPISEASEFPALGARVQRLDRPPKRVTPMVIAATSTTAAAAAAAAPAPLAPAANDSSAEAAPTAPLAISLGAITRRGPWRDALFSRIER